MPLRTRFPEHANWKTTEWKESRVDHHVGHDMDRRIHQICKVEHTNNQQSLAKQALNCPRHGVQEIFCRSGICLFIVVLLCLRLWECLKVGWSNNWGLARPKRITLQWLFGSHNHQYDPTWFNRHVKMATLQPWSAGYTEKWQEHRPSISPWIH